LLTTEDKLNFSQVGSVSP